MLPSLQLSMMLLCKPSACEDRCRYQRVRVHDSVGNGIDYPIFWIDRFHPHSTKQHTAFVAKSREEVDAFYAAAIKAGGTDNGAPPDRSEQSTPVYYAAFVLDPDGSNIEATFRS